MSRIVKLSALAGLTLCLASADKVLSVKDIMGKLNKGPKALTSTLRRGLQSDSPDWESIQQQSKKYEDLTQDLTKADPPVGGKASWDKLTKAYASNALALEEAAQKKDKSAALQAHGKLLKSCKACHDAHKG